MMVVVVGAVLGDGTRRTHNQSPVLHTLCADEFIRESLNVSRFPPQHDDLQTVVMIEVRMDGRNDHPVMFVLQVGQFLGQQACVVIVDESYSAHNQGVGGNDRRAHKAVSNQVAEGLRSILVSLRGDEGVKFV